MSGKIFALLIVGAVACLFISMAKAQFLVKEMPLNLQPAPATTDNRLMCSRYSGQEIPIFCYPRSSGRNRRNQEAINCDFTGLDNLFGTNGIYVWNYTHTYGFNCFCGRCGGF
jgi:hypothetical protein